MGSTPLKQPRQAWRTTVLCAIALALSCWLWSAAPRARAESPQPSPAKVDFKRDVEPILSQRCQECHGPSKQKGGLRLDSKEHAFQGGDSGDKPITPGDPEKSKLIHLVRGDEPDEIMPPKGDPLTAKQIDTLKSWIQRGAAWPDGKVATVVKPAHWSFNKPVRPQFPAVKRAEWCRNP